MSVSQTSVSECTMCRKRRIRIASVIIPLRFVVISEHPNSDHTVSISHDFHAMSSQERILYIQAGQLDQLIQTGTWQRPSGLRAEFIACSKSRCAALVAPANTGLIGPLCLSIAAARRLSDCCCLLKTLTAVSSSRREGLFQA